MQLAQERRTPTTRGAIDRRSPAYIRWVQSVLNRVRGAGLVVDGTMTPQTRNALRAFQAARGLPADGVAGARTEAALTAASTGIPTNGTARGAAVRVGRTLPAAGRGYYCYAPAARRFALPATIRAVQALGEAWYRNHPRGPRIGIGDLSLRGGAPTAGHPSHHGGLSIDIRPMRNDGREGTVRYPSPVYSRALTQELVRFVRANGILPVEAILFSDPKLVGVRHRPGFAVHLHVRFAAPGTHALPVRHGGMADRRTPTYIRWLQQSLNRLRKANLRIDGVLSPPTRGALRAFQGERGLPADGVAGPRTEAALIAAGASPPPASGGATAPRPVGR